jgi:thioredoxin reductase
MGSSSRLYDAIILGAGPAGLSAALVLSRVRRPCVVISIPGAHRNADAPEMHLVLSRDGMSPPHYLKASREELLRYGFAVFLDGKAVSATKSGEGFRVKLEDETEVFGKKLVFATGVKDVYPQIEGHYFLKTCSNIRLCGTLGLKNSELCLRPRIREQGSSLRINWRGHAGVE